MEASFAEPWAKNNGDGKGVEVNLANMSAMHKTSVDGAKKAPFPKLPGLVIRGQGDAR